MHRFIILLSFITVTSLNYYVSAQTPPNVSTIDSAMGTSTTIATSSTVKPDISCEVHKNNCKACVEKSGCYYCVKTNECHSDVTKGIVDGQCKVADAYTLTCKANAKTMLIIIGCLSGIAVLIVVIVCCYCCCKKKGIKISKDDIKWARQREERKQMADERRRERAERTEEIRRKYGLVKDSNPYQKFDA